MPEAHWTAIAAFWIGIGAALVAAVAATINYYFFRAHIDPLVIVYATADEQRPSFINLIIENIGKGLARDVVFEFSEPLPEKAFGFADAPMPNRMVSGPLIQGIPALGPGGRRVITWGQFGGLYKALGDRVVTIRVRFRGDGIGVFSSSYTEVTCPLDVRSFAGTDASDRNYAKQIARHVRRIADVLERSASGFRPLVVKVPAKRKPKREPEA